MPPHSYHSITHISGVYRNFYILPVRKTRRMDQKSVILDANVVLTPYQFHFDIFRELDDLLEPPYKLLIPTCVINEVKKLSKGRGKEAMAARFALKLIDVNCESGKLSKIKGSAPADDWIVDYSSKNGAIVCTNDVGLKERLRAVKVKVISMKSRSRLGFV